MPRLITTPKIRRLYAGTVVVFIAVVGLFFLAARLLNFENVVLVLTEIPVWMLPALLALSLINYACRLLRWRLLLRGHHINASPRVIALSYLAGLSMTATPGKFGEVIRLWLLERLDKVPYTASVAALIGDRVGDLLAVLFLGSLGYEIVSEHYSAIAAVTALAGLLVALWHRLDLVAPALKVFYKITGKFRRKIARIRFLLRNSRPQFSYTQVIAILSLSVLGWLAEGVGFYILLAALKVNVPVSVAISIFCLSILLGSVSMLPGGIGGTELTMIALLKTVGATLDVSIVATGVTRIATLWFAVGIGLLVLPIALRAASVQQHVLHTKQSAG